MANTVRDSIPDGVVPKDRRLNQIAERLEEELFLPGRGFAAIKAVVEKLKARSLFRLVSQPETTSHMNDTKTQMLTAVKYFLKDIMASKGRRSTMNNNVYYGVLAAVLPDTLVQDRKQREVARMLGVKQSVVRKAIDMRSQLVQGEGWVDIKNAEHTDKVDWDLVRDWLHSDDGSTIDNDHKQYVPVKTVDKETGEVKLVNHPRRRPNGSKEDTYLLFQQSALCSKIKADYLANEKNKRITVLPC